MTNVSRKIDVAANVAILCVAVIVGIIAIKQYLLLPAKTIPPTIKVGQQVPIKDVDWSRQAKSLVLAVSSNCHFCRESAPFYQRLMHTVERNNTVHVMAVLPQSVENGVSYLKSLAVPISDIRQVAFNTIPIGGTPTILLVNSRGVVEKTWVGKLTSQLESDVLKDIGCTEQC